MFALTQGLSLSSPWEGLHDDQVWSPWHPGLHAVLAPSRHTHFLALCEAQWSILCPDTELPQLLACFQDKDCPTLPVGEPTKQAANSI